MYLASDRADPLIYNGRTAVYKSRYHPDKVFVILSSSQYNSLGAVLNHFYYNNDQLRALAPSVASSGYIGFPHNGGEHTCQISGTPADVESFLQLMHDDYATRNIDHKYTAALRVIAALRDEVLTYEAKVRTFAANHKERA